MRILLTLLILLRPTDGLRLAVLSKVIVDTIDGERRPGGGGVQAAVGATLGNPSLETSLHAPVGCDFALSVVDDRSLAAQHGVDLAGVTRLEHVATTPGEIISYGPGGRMQFVPVGWESWEALCEWVPPLADAPYDAMHVIVEGAGGGEVDAALAACATAAELPLITLEPVMQEVTPASVQGLCRLSRYATLASPDLATAVCICAVSADAASPEDGADAAANFPPRRPAAVTDDVLAAARANASVVNLAATCFDSLCMQPGSCLAIRDGAHGSYLYTRPAPDAPAWQWLASAPGNREHEWCVTVPAVDLQSVADPTGAGNAYAGAFCSQLASGAALARAAARASAVGAAFCRTEQWAPPNVAETRRWVAERSAEIERELEQRAQQSQCQ